MTSKILTVAEIKQILADSQKRLEEVNALLCEISDNVDRLGEESDRIESGIGDYLQILEAVKNDSQNI